MFNFLDNHKLANVANLLNNGPKSEETKGLVQQFIVYVLQCIPEFCFNVMSIILWLCRLSFLTSTMPSQSFFFMIKGLLSGNKAQSLDTAFGSYFRGWVKSGSYITLEFWQVSESSKRLLNLHFGPSLSLKAFPAEKKNLYI